MQKRRKAREAALQALYKADVSESGDIEGLDLSCYLADIDTGKESRAYGERILNDLSKSLAEVDDVIGRVSTNWSLARMNVIDRSVLRLAVAEFMNEKDVPMKVVIDEAIELAKSYGTDESPSFVNAVLDKAVKDLK